MDNLFQFHVRVLLWGNMDFELGNLFDETFFHETEDNFKVVVKGKSKEQPQRSTNVTN